MPFIKRNRQCGCDCRDPSTPYADDPAIFNPLGCTTCNGQKPPCHYLLHFPCAVKMAGSTLFSGDIILLPICPFQNSCSYSEQIGFQGGRGNGCTSTGGKSGSTILPKWVMDISSSPVKAIYTSGTVRLEYTATGPWNCYGQNNVKLTSAVPAQLTGYPDVLCITPDLTNYCNDNCVQTPPNFCQPNSYNTEANRLLCCDPHCNDSFFPGTIIARRVDGTGTTFTFNRQVGADSNYNAITGLSSPSGPSYVVTTDTIYAGNRIGAVVRGVMYCSNGAWKVDWYQATTAAPTVFTFVSTVNFTSTCCPLLGCTSAVTMTFGSGDWFICASLGGPCPCSGSSPPSICCADADETNCHVTVTSSCGVINGRTIAMTRTGSHTWSGSPGFGITAVMDCGVTTPNVWTLAFSFVGTCGSIMTSTNVVCTPGMSGTFSGTIAGTVCAPCTSGDTISIVVTV